LGPNYPNPFNPTTTIPVAVPVTSEIKLKIYNLLGAEVKMIYDGTIEAGRYWFNWDGRNEAGNTVATGVYLYRLSTSTGTSLLGKMILIR
jgi:flagellar hook assembly protein FlgD